LTKGSAPHSLAVVFRKDSVATVPDFQSPWRTISVATSAIGLHQFSDLPLRLSPPPANGVPAWIKPGKLIRSALTTQAGLDCIDFAVKHDLQYIMFDAGWYGAEFRGSSDPTQVIPAIDMPKVIQYGKEKKIRRHSLRKPGGFAGQTRHHSAALQTMGRGRTEVRFCGRFVAGGH
jgi:alpha-glucosidase